MTFHLYFRMAAPGSGANDGVETGSVPASGGNTAAANVGHGRRDYQIGSALHPCASQRFLRAITSFHAQGLPYYEWAWKEVRVIKPGALDLGRLRQKNSDVMATV